MDATNKKGSAGVPDIPSGSKFGGNSRPPSPVEFRTPVVL
jgi:hypothetical protein